MQAQPPGGGRGDRNASPEERAERQTQHMVKALNLSAAQGEKIQVVNLEFGQKLQTARAEARASGDREAMRAAMKAMRDEHQESLKKYLTIEQAEKWAVISAEQETKMKANRKKRGKRKQMKEKKSR